MGSKKSHGRDWRGGEAVAVRQWKGWGPGTPGSP